MKNQMTPKSTGHFYDGIEEYDNGMPGWWRWLFAGSIIFSLGYFFIAVLAGEQMGPRGEYDRELTADAVQQFASMGEIQSDPASLLALTHNEKVVRIGRAMFQNTCAACHGPGGAGLSGPNLTDEVYIHVKTVGDVTDVIRKGRNFGAMPAWENRLQPREISVLAAYVLSLRGTNVPGREPQGRAIPAWSDK